MYNDEMNNSQYNGDTGSTPYGSDTNSTSYGSAYNAETHQQTQQQPPLTKKGLKAMRKAHTSIRI